MRKIITIDKPFEMAKTFMVYEDGNKIAIEHYTVDDRIEKLFALIEKYEIRQIDLVGPKKYMTGIKNQIDKANNSKFEFKDLEINII